jgi:hypothetical protein
MIGELSELVDWCRTATAGWRFLFSSTYRRMVISGWRDERWFYVTWDIICGLSGIAFTLLILAGVTWLIMEIFR